jgi:hypothetical protein
VQPLQKQLQQLLRSQLRMRGRSDLRFRRPDLRLRSLSWSENRPDAGKTSSLLQPAT